VRRVFTILAALCLTACSGLKLAYQNADTYLRFQADKYFAFQDDASLELDRRIAAFLDWHRAEALPQYAKASEEASRRMLRGIKREDLEWAYDVFRGHARGTLRRAGREMAPLLDALSAGQIARLEQRLADENRKFAREQLQGTVEERSERRYRRNLKRLEEWFGPLSAEQAERVRGYALTPTDSELHDRDRKRRQAEFVAILRARAARQRLAEWAADWDGGRDPAYAQAARQLREAYFDLLLDLDRSLTPQQRQHAARRMSEYAATFASLAQQ
jgi:uncharacterized protein DUF6279